MRTIIHVSDIHFGRFDTACLEPMLATFNKLSPNLVIISGDLTQRARKKEFAAAQDFIRRIRHPSLIIPGNHDIRPIHTPIKRLLRPYDRYHKYISSDIEPSYIDRELVVTSINTVRNNTIKDGKVSISQIDRVCEWFEENKKSRPGAFQVIVTHHPLNLPKDFKVGRKLASQAKLAIHRLAETGVDVYLAGHFHQSSISHTAERHKIDGYSAVFVQAGTVSNRQRKEQQSFNIIRINKPTISVETYLWNPETKVFELNVSRTYSGGSRKWQEVEQTIATEQ